MRLLAPKASGHLLLSKGLSLLTTKGKTTTFGQVLQQRQEGLGSGAGAHLTGGSHRTLGVLPEGDESGRAKKPRPAEGAPLDSAARHAAQLEPPFMAPPPAEAVALEAHASLEGLLPSLVRRVAWSGDGKKGTIRLELGGGELAGGTLLIHADGGRIAVHLTTPEGSNVAQWRDRIAARLTAKGLDLERIDVE